MKKKLSRLLVAVIIAACLPFQVSAEESCTHQWSSWDIISEPTCGDTGEEMRYCTECYEEETKEIPATNDHDWSSWEVTKKATISKEGVKKRECWEWGAIQKKSIAKLKPFAKFSKSTVNLKSTQTYKLKLSYAKGDSIVKWKSSNKKVATVSNSGNITAKSKGTTTITAVMKSKKKATCKIKVSVKKKSSSSGGSGTVYWTPGGSVYHSTKNCPTLSRSRTIISGSKSSCPKPRGCKVCY